MGSSPNDRATLRQAVGGSLLFAGEAASLEYPGTAHGALLSGLEQAAALLQTREASAGSEEGSCAGGGGGCYGGPAA